MEKVRKFIKFTGSVQGVGFRYRAYYAAQGLGLTGWVENEDDGSVHMEVQGTEAEISELISKIQLGRWVSIDDMYERKIPLEPDERDFRIL